MPSPGINTTCMCGFLSLCRGSCYPRARSVASGRRYNVPLPGYATARRLGVYDNILQSVGRTPLVRLRRVAEGLQVPVYVKFEASNPAGSVKDRVAIAMINDAERRGLLKPG